MVLTQSRYKQELQQLILEVQQRAFHPFVQEYINYPEINVLQLHLSYLFLTNTDVTEKQKNMITTSQMFIQLGLDTHDEVPVTVHDPDQHITERQLTVLSGDFFSSYYYLFLAENGQIELIQKWAEVIQRFNEQKMDMHVHSKQLSTEDSFDRLCQIRSILTDSVLSWYGADEDWFQINKLLTRLVAGLDIWKPKSANLEQLFASAEAIIKRFHSHTVRQELGLWLEKIRSAQLVTEP